jgi:uncharacterized membrane protein
MSAAYELFNGNLSWMGWNLFLACIPLILGLILFTPQKPLRFNSSGRWRNFFWWLGVIVFMLFLPNAAYIFTDIIHLVNDVRSPNISRSGLVFLIIPQYICFLVLGFQCYVFSLIELSDYLSHHHLINKFGQLIWLELGINFVCAVGVYLGRFNRLNSWNVVTKPITLVRTVADNLDSWHFVKFTLLFFGVITILYYLSKQIRNAAIARN